MKIFPFLHIPSALWYSLLHGGNRNQIKFVQGYWLYKTKPNFWSFMCTFPSSTNLTPRRIQQSVVRNPTEITAFFVSQYLGRTSSLRIEFSSLLNGVFSSVEVSATTCKWVRDVFDWVGDQRKKGAVISN